ncbi:MAG: alpha-N-acetylglucosaminidase [Clostridiales bacterium]|nr:alpha-N-acetylglucosaminidase [Clostridiales bacterium]
MKNIILSLSVAALSLLNVACGKVDPDVEAARSLTERVVPSIASHFEYTRVERPDSVDYFTLSQDGDKIKVEANCAGSMAMGLNYYLKNYCLATVSWYATDEVQLPDDLPDVDAPVTVEARVPNRFFLNYCTSGYSMPWWSWSDWERFIDWMAMNGINMPLATTGQEAIWYNVWSKLGLSDEEIRSYFTAPAHLPWHRMCNLDGWQSPLPQSWLDDQADLQKRIVDRERQLSMRPVLPGFAGHVPAALAAKFPDAKITRVSQWGGFPDEYRCSYLSPEDSLFNVIQREYLTEQTRLYGTDHIYGIDPFNEVDPPTWNPDSLAMMSNRLYRSVADVDPQAVWLQMAWILYADPEHWTPETAKAYIQGVPQGRMILLDYYCESVEEWKLFDSFYGQPYIWCYLGNFGGNSFLASPFKEVDRRIDDVYAHGGSNLVGLGSTLEGIDVNPYIYEYVLDRAWNMPEPADSAFMNIIDRRVGYVDPHARQAWTLLLDSIMFEPALCGQGPLVNARPSLTGFSWWTTKPNVGYPNARLVQAWGDLLAVDSSHRYAHAFDCVNLGRQAMSNYFMALRDDFTRAYESRDTASLIARGNEMKELLGDLTTLLNSNHGTRMDKWIADARAKGVNPEEKDYYDRNARTIISIWGPSQELNDYANRQWAELNATYYTPRWTMFIDRVIDAAKERRRFDADEFFVASRQFENRWIEPRALEVEVSAPADDKTVARAMYEKWAPSMVNHPASGAPTDCISLHHW